MSNAARILPPPRRPGADIARDLAARGFAVCPDFLPPDLLRRLRSRSLLAWRAGGFRHAGVGRGDTFRVDPAVRSDRVLWLDPAAVTGAPAHYLERMDRLRLTLNRALLLGLWGFEAHLTVYPPGAFYQRHVDRHRNTEHRVVSAILYLNDGWLPEDGGALRLHLPDGPLDVLPAANTLAVFVTEGLEHEVLPATRDRLSITGWFRTRS